MREFFKVIPQLPKSRNSTFNAGGGMLLTALLLLLVVPSSVFGGGRKQIITETAEGIDIWQKEFDVSGMKPGTYNYIVNAKDAAGNVGVSGPFNIKIDPMAGLPEARVVYPDQGQVVRDNVTIVGVASARYGVKEILVRIDNEPPVSLPGNEYWSLFIPSMDLVEGKHVVYVHAIDEQDKSGPEFKMDFTLDLLPPAIDLIDREIGDLIAGKVTIKGQVSDANGLQSLALSTDGEHFSKLKFSSKRGSIQHGFQFPIASKQYEDGPIVYYIRATNKTGNSSTTPLLFFVNNYPPQIEIISPETGEDTFGKTQVIGRVISGVGLTEFYYEWAGVRGDIPLRPGDPFWIAEFPISMANNRGIPFKVTAVDKSGNTTTISQRFQDTRKNRAPALVIDYPPAPGGLGRMELAPDQPIYGHILPGFFPYAIIIEGEIEYVMAQPSFRIPPEIIPEGRNTMRFWAIDEDDVTGEAYALRINKQAGGGYVEESPLIIEYPEEYSWFGDSVTINGSIEEFETGWTLEYRLRWDDPWKPVNVDRIGDFEAVISLSDLPEGAVPLELRSIRDGQADFPYYLPLNKFITKPVINILTPNKKYGSIYGNVTTTGIVDYFVPLSRIDYSIDGGLTFDGMDFIAKSHRAWFNEYIDYTAMERNNQQLIVRVVDRAGNRLEVNPEIEFDDGPSFPIIILNTPLDDQLISGDFDISGLSFADCGVKMVYWRILSPRNPWDPVPVTLDRHGDVEFNRIETEQNFLANVTIDDVTDGINILEIFAEDIYGVACEVIQRTFRVSTAPPETVVLDPPIDLWNKGNIMVSGTSFDLNGIRQILVSMDNGISYQRADFTSSQTEPSPWSIALNTKAYADGIYSMLIRTIDQYGISAFASGIINIDNTPPEIDLGSPGNGDRIGLELPITGQVYDNITLARISIELVNVENPEIRRDYDLPTDNVIMEHTDVSAFPDGDYTVKVVTQDLAGNETSMIRNVNILKTRAASEVALINPMPGIIHRGPMVVSGKITGAVIPETVTLMLNRQVHTQVEVDRYGIFRYDMPNESLVPNSMALFSAYFTTPNGERIDSFDNPVLVRSDGPVIIIDSHGDGDVITQRPWLTGRAFYLTGNENPGEEEDSRKSSRSARNDARSVPQVVDVQISFDNGRTFQTADGRSDWKYRLETSELPAGSMPIVARAVFDDESVAVRRIFLVVDTRPPTVHTIGPPENSTHRTSVAVYGSAGDDYDMDSVEVILRPGDKNLYSVPGFIQGLYFDGNFLGGHTYQIGLGLTFFDDNVKVQFNATNAPAGGRLPGWAFGGKVLANVWKKNLSDWINLDWQFWTTSLVVGAHFSYFLMEEGETPMWMGELLGQWEIIKADLSFLFPKWKYFKSISLYMEPGIWFAPTAVVNNEDAWTTKFVISLGARISLF